MNRHFDTPILSPIKKKKKKKKALQNHKICTYYFINAEAVT
jgi:hypothetical protein